MIEVPLSSSETVSDNTDADNDVDESAAAAAGDRGQSSSIMLVTL